MGTTAETKLVRRSLRGRGTLVVGMVTIGALAGCVQQETSAASKPYPTYSPSRDIRQDAATTMCPPGLIKGPKVTVVCLGDGAEVQSERAPGRNLLINFYNVYCLPCREEMGLLRQYSELPGPAQLIGVDSGDSPNVATQYIIDFRVTWPALLDESGGIFRRFAPGWPVTVAVTADGSLRGRPHIGPFKNLEDIQMYVKDVFG